MRPARKHSRLAALKRAQTANKDKLLEQVRAVKAFYGIREQCLETLLTADALL